MAQAWAFRAQVEADATVQFTRLGDGLQALSAPARLVEVARRAAEDEARHQVLCEALAAAYGAGPRGPPAPAPTLAPSAMRGREALAYALAAHACIAETESVATLTLLIPRAGPPRVKQALQAIARDEVEHAQLGWGALAWLAAQAPLAFLGPWVPAMLGPGAGPLFQPSLAAAEDPRLEAHGVLTATGKREVFVEALEGVVLPGLERLGVPIGPAQAWLAAQAR